ncbi:hypothetical protein NKG05_08905 [Oerskovia sp. M15]
MLSLLLTFSLLDGQLETAIFVVLVTVIGLLGIALSAAFLVLSPKVARGNLTARTVALWLTGVGIGLRVLGMLDGGSIATIVVGIVIVGLGVKVIVQLCTADVRSFVAGR